MSCGRNCPFCEDLSIWEDLFSVIGSQNVFLCIRLDIHANILKIMMEEKNLEDKFNVYLMLQNIVLKSIVADLKKEQLTTETELTIDGKLAKIKELGGIYYSVKREKVEFEEKQKQLFELMSETEVVWLNEPVLDESSFRKMTSKDRKDLVKLWRDREGVAEQGRLLFEELKTEWDSRKVEFDLNLMECLRGIVNLKDFP